MQNGDISIHYQQLGRENGEPLVLLHWFMGSMETFEDVGYIRLLKAHFRLILLDHRGYGASSKPHEPEAYRPEHHVSDLIVLLDHLGIETAHFLGYSMGGRIAFALAKFAPDRVLSLIIGGMHPYKEIPTDLEERKRLLAEGMDAVLDAYGIHLSVVRERMLQNDPQALLADTIQTQSWEDFGPELQRFNRPILLFVGEEDGFYAGAKRASQELGNVTFVAFPNENHRTAFVKRNLLVPHLARFLRVRLG